MRIYKVIGSDEAPEKTAEIWDLVPSPSYVIDSERLTKNLETLLNLRYETGCKILLAQKAFSMFHFYPLIGKYLDGAASSGLFESRLAFEEMGKEVHVFSPAYRDDEFNEILKYSDHVVFNSFYDWEKFGKRAADAGRSCGLRINPEHSTQKNAIYDPCAPFSRLGIRAEDFYDHDLTGIEGLHFHTLCEQGAEPLLETFDEFERKFGKYLSKMKWINFGGGHHITKSGYNMKLLIDLILRVKEQYKVNVYLEPGEAIALDAGELVTTVLSVLPGKNPAAILDTSAACHAPDVIEMPYRPPLYGSGNPGEKSFTYILGGPTCLAGDVFGEYSFDTPLSPGDRLAFGDMAIYSMVKNNTFNGMNLPTIVSAEDGSWKIKKKFGYEDFKRRLS